MVAWIGRSRGGGERCLYFKCILKMELIGFIVG